MTERVTSVDFVVAAPPECDPSGLEESAERFRAMGEKACAISGCLLECTGTLNDEASVITLTASCENQNPQCIFKGKTPLEAQGALLAPGFEMLRRNNRKNFLDDLE